jgi:hypothetical protein
VKQLLAHFRQVNISTYFDWTPRGHVDHATYRTRLGASFLRIDIHSKRIVDQEEIVRSFWQLAGLINVCPGEC